MRLHYIDQIYDASAAMALISLSLEMLEKKRRSSEFERI
jgi:hypothetical protein